MIKTPPKKRKPLDLVRKNIMKLEPYRCARDDYSNGMLMDANENSYGPPVVGLSEKHTNMELNRYPDPRVYSLKKLIGKYRGVTPENIFIGVGSDEAIDLLLRIFCVPGKDSIIICPPTYGMYSVSADVNDVKIKKAPLTPAFDIDIPGILTQQDATTKMVWVCSPGNPTSHAIPHAEVKKLCESNFDGIVVLDEAYVDFSEEGSACTLVSSYPNLVVLQTLSKGFGLAGIRLGMAYASPEIIQIMNNVKAPYSINKLTSDIAEQAYTEASIAKFNAVKNTILAERTRVSKALADFKFVTKVHPSDTNFILFQIPRHAKKVYSTMANKGIVVRYRGNCLHCTDCLRVTVGTPEENDAFLRMLPAVYREVSVQ